MGQVSPYTIRRCTINDAATIARHRVEMFRDMGDVPRWLDSQNIKTVSPETLQQAAVVAGYFHDHAAPVRPDQRPDSFGVFGVVAGVVGKTGAGVFAILAVFLFTVTLGLFIHAVNVLSNP